MDNFDHEAMKDLKARVALLEKQNEAVGRTLTLLIGMLYKQLSSANQNQLMDIFYDIVNLAEE